MRSSVGYPRGKSSMTFDWRIAFATSDEVSGNDVKKDINYKKTSYPDAKQRRVSSRKKHDDV